MNNYKKANRKVKKTLTENLIMNKQYLKIVYVIIFFFLKLRMKNT